MGAGKGTAPRPLGGRGPLYLSDSLTALLLTLGGFFAFLSACGAVWPAWMPAAVGAMALAAVLVWSLPRGAYLAAGGILALGALAVWRRWELLVPTLEALWSVMAEDLGSLVILTQTVESTGGAALWYGSAEALLWLAGLYALAMGWAAVRQRWWYVALALALLPSAPAIAAGTMPDWLALMAALAGGLALLLSDLFAPEDPAALGRGQMVSLGTTVLLLAALNLALPQEGYVRPQWADTAHNWVVEAGQRAAEAVLGLELPEGGGAGAGSGGTETLVLDDGGAEDLTQAGPRRFSGRTVLVLEGEGQGRLYLRGSALADYTGESWEALDSALYEEAFYQMAQATVPELSRAEEEAGYEIQVVQEALAPLLWPAQTSTGEVRSLLVRPAAVSSVAYTPDQLLLPLSGGLSLYQDSAVLAENGLESYQLIYRDGDLSDVNLSLTGAAAAAEEVYRSFVHDQYAAVPDRAAAALAPLLEEMESVAVQPAEVPEAYRPAVETARRAAAVLAARASYSINVPAMEPGEDFVEHFLAEGRGYCVHFATAGTLLLRMAGYPARYVSGFAAYLTGTGRTAVADSAAHAWVEIYLDGYGWYPVEMTPAYLGEGGTADETEPLPDPTEPVEPQTSEETPQEDLETPPEEGGETEDPGWELDLRWLGYAALVLLVCGALVLPRYLARALRRRQAAIADTGRSVVAAYRWCRRLSRWGGAECPELERLAGKAVFSQHRITEEERSAAWAMARTAAGETEKRLSPVKRLAFRWLFLLS